MPCSRSSRPSFFSQSKHSLLPRQPSNPNRHQPPPNMPNNTGQRRYFSHCLPPRRKPKTVDPLFSYIAVAEKQGSLLQTILSSACTAAKGEGKESACRRRKIGRSCRRALMAALNHTSLVSLSAGFPT